MDGSNQIFEHLSLKKKPDDKWVITEDGKENSESVSSVESLEDSTNSASSSLHSSELMEDASSLGSCTSSSSSSNGPLYELSELVAQLPIKRGLSKFYEGKSQSFTSLASVKSLEDLVKKGAPCRLKMKSCKSYAAGLDCHKKPYSPKATISKKPSTIRGSFLSSIGRNNLVSACRPSLRKNF
ncbi:uncharacterized protein LOC123194508 [Mangifera indica]|uniref:uncharacterized protein LOC123194508 n=1 Tax=Mangifera indica TaxID=29780 RepID=UPI001CFA598D|nr:uncharacterized protein LOC123194508 [Mangifera indica]